MVKPAPELEKPELGRGGFPVASLIAVALLIGSGLVHGRLTDRWATSGAMVEAVTRLERVPRSIGEWSSRGPDVPMDRRQIDLAQIRGYLARKYRHDGDGREITILLVCGRPGPIAVHTPDVCYTGAGYHATSSPEPWTQAANGQQDEFLKARFRKVDAIVPEALDIAWAWNARGVWEVPTNPRIDFAVYPALFKLYIIAGRAGAEADRPGPPIVDEDFVRLATKAINQALFEGDRGTDGSASTPGPSPSTR